MENQSIDIGLPDKLEFHDHGSYLEFVRKWFGWHVVFGSVFLVFWFGFLIIWYSNLDADAPTLALLLPLIHIAAGLGILYFVVANWANKTRILVSPNKIAVRISPIPWFGNKELDATQVVQLYTKQKVTSRNNGTSISYEVQVISDDRRNIPLVTGLQTSEQAQFIEQKIEKYLKIADRPVNGEY